MNSLPLPSALALALTLVSSCLPALAQTPLACSSHDRSGAHAVAVAAADLAGLQRCVDEDDAVAQNELGRRYGLGKGTARDAQRSFALYRMAAEAGYAPAQANLGFMYSTGEGVAKDPKTGYAWSLRAAEAGDPQGQYAVAYAHLLGEGAARDGRQAQRWLHAAADQGYVTAQQALIRFYSDGELIARDPRQAVLWTHRVRDATLFGQVWTADGRVSAPR